MKKNTISTLAMLAAFAMAVSTVDAQILVPTETVENSYEGNVVVIEDEEDDKDQDVFLDRAVHDETVEMPQAEKQNITIDYCAPLGSGILLLSCLGGAYLLGKRRKE